MAYSLPGVGFQPRTPITQSGTDEDFTGFRFFAGDFVLSDTGALEKVRGISKVKRDIAKLLNTDRENEDNRYDTVVGLSRYNPQYGTSLRESRRFNNLGKDEIISTINILVESALSYYVSIQKQQSNIPFDEVVDYFDYFTAFDPDRPQVVLCGIDVTMASGQSFTINSNMEI